jgi:transposase
MLLGLEDVEQVVASAEAEQDEDAPEGRAARARKRRSNRGALPAHLRRIEIVVDLEDKTCPCCQGELHRIGEDKSERLEGPRHPAAQIRLPIMRGRRPAGASSDAADRGRIADRGHCRPGSGLQIRRPSAAIPASPDLRPPGHRAGSFDAGGLGRSRRLALAPAARASPRQAEATAKTVRRRDDHAGAQSRPRAHQDRPALGLRDRRPAVGRRGSAGVAYVYAPDRKAERPIAHLAGFKGILQVDGYAKLAERGDVELAFCWSHMRRNFYELATPGPAPIASEALKRIAEIYAIEKDIRGRSAEERRLIRQQKSQPLAETFEQGCAQNSV